MMDSNNNTNQQFHHHYQYQSNQQQQQQQTFKPKSTVEENNNAFTNLDAFLESPQFLTDTYIKSLIDKAITLGIVWEVIKETLGRFLLNIINNNSLDLEVNGINYSRLIDEEKFFEQLILYSIQVENSNSNKQQHGSSKNEFGDDYNENDDEDYEPTNETVEQPSLANENEFELAHQFNRISMNNDSSKAINRPPVISSNLNTMAAAVAKKQVNMQQQMPLTAQQKIQQEQDFITQSINRINDKSNLRPIIVDSNDVALSSHSNKQVFLFSRIKQVVDYFEKRNHQIYVILSSWRKEQIMSSPLSNSASPASTPVQNVPQQTSSQTPAQQQPLTPDQLALIEMEQKNQVYYTPSKRVGAKRIVCDDDSYMLKLSVAKMGIIVSNDNFKRFLNHSEDFKLVIEERVLMYSFIDNTFMPAEDPLGKNGPSLDNFLRFESFVNQQYMKRCPYRKKCTYGSKCKFWHPERGLHQGNQLFKTAHQSVLDEAQEQKMRLEIILNKNSYSVHNMANNQQQLSMYNVDNETVDNDDEHNDENSIKLLNRIKQQKHQYSGLMNSANIYNLHEFDSLKISEQTWALNKADSELTFINKTNQNQHVQSFQKVGLYGEKLHELRAMGPDSSMKMSSIGSMQSMNGSNKSSINHSKMNSINVAAAQIKNNSSFNQNSFNYSPNMLWDNVMKGNNNVSGIKNKNDFDFESLHHQTGLQHQQSFQQLETQQNNQKMLKTKLNESKQNDISETFSLFAPTQATGSSSTPTSVSPPLGNSGENLRAQLISQNLNPKLVDDVLNKYKGETDIEKLIFLARGISFSSDF